MKARRWMLALPPLCALLIYAPTLDGAYTLDDDAVVAANPAVVGAAPLAEVFTREYWGRPLSAGWSSSYRPLVSLSLAIEERVLPGPWLHRLMNLLLYAALVTLVLHLCRQRAGDAVAVAVAVAFAVVPLHADNAASIVGRADTMATILALWAVMAARRGAVVVAAVSYGAALLCKESVALVPAVAAWLWWVDVRADSPVHDSSVHDSSVHDSSVHDSSVRVASLRSPRVRALIALAAVGVGYLALRSALLPVGLPATFVGADNVLAGSSGPLRWWGNLAIIEHYAEVVLSPMRLCSDHTYADVMPPQGVFGRDAWRSWVGLGVVAAVGYDGWRAWRGRSAGLWVAAGLAYLVIGQWVVDLSVIMADRLLIWPMALVAVAVAAGYRRPRRRLVAVAACATFVCATVAYAAVAYDHGQDWTDRVRLHRSSVARCPAAVHNRLNLAVELSHRAASSSAQSQDVSEAAWHFGVAAAGHQRFPQRFDVEAFAAEKDQPLAQRLPRLPALVQAADADAYWRGLEGMVRRLGHAAVADRIAGFVARGGAAGDGASEPR